MFSTLFSNHSTLRKIILLCLGVFILQSVPCYRSIAQFYNGSHTDFGKSRVQHRKFFWYFYRFREFNVYFYTGCKEPADYVVKTADSIISEMERFLDYTLDEKIFFIVFNNLRELQQSNIGFVTDQMYNTGGITRVVGTKIFLQHEGSYTNLREQIRSGIAETVINQMLMGGTIRDRLKSSTLLVLPEWYTKGLVSYAAKGWSTEMDNYIKDGVKSGKIRKFNNLSGADAILTGHAIWNYIAERYGHSVIPGILYMTKLSRNIESGFLYVLGTSLSTLTYDCLDYYLARADADDGNRSSPPTEPILVKSRQQTLYGNFRLNHDKKYAVYTSNNRGKFKLLLYDVNNNRSSVLFKGGYKREEIINDNYPVAAWHPSKNILTIFFEKKGRLWIRMIDPESEKNPVILTREMHQLNNIFDFSYHPDGNKLVMSAVKQSQNDIFVYGISSNNIEQVTDDIFDDRQPQFTSDGKKIIFSSNRSADTLYTLKTDHFSDSATFPVPNSNKDIFIYNSQSRSRMLGRLTGSHDIDESAPEEYSPGLYTYLSDRNGIVNRYLVKTDSVISHIDTIAHYRATLTTLPMTNYARNILDQNVPDGSNSITELIRHDDDFNFYIHEKRDASELSEIRAPETAYRRILEKETEKKRKAKEKSGREEEADPFKSLDILFMEDTSGTVEPEGKKSEKIDIDNYRFDNEVTKPGNEKEMHSGEGSVQEQAAEDTVDYVHPFRLSRQWVYKPAFLTDYFVSQLDNSYLEASYQKFAGGGAVYTQPGLNGLLKLGISDVLEDYRITGGFRVSGDLNNNEYLLLFEFLKNRLDKRLILHRQSLLQVIGYSYLVRIQTHEAKMEYSWPFSEVCSVKGTLLGRNDRITTLSTDINGLATPARNENSAGLKGQFIYDNTINRSLNIYYGTRLKIFTEGYSQLGENNKMLYVVGTDVRDYRKIYRDFIWANRFAAGTSFGDQKLVFYLGGVDGWFKPDFDESTYIDPNQNFAYQTLATNMRGFIQNVRNGNSFAVINSELRFPIVRFIYPNPIRSDFLYNLQLIAFTDVGTAWTGPHPYSEDNSLNVQIIDKSPAFLIRITRKREPIVAGYGFGVRSRIWGYFIRVDWARGIEENTLLKHIWYVSLSLDF